VWRGVARQGEARAALGDAIFIGADLQGRAGRGMAWRGQAGSGRAWAAHGGENPSVRICEARQGRVWCGAVWYGGVWFGEARLGRVWQGLAWLGEVWQGPHEWRNIYLCGFARHGTVWWGRVGSGKAGRGKVWSGEVWQGMGRMSGEIFTYADSTVEDQHIKGGLAWQTYISFIILQKVT
jgi:hypothetical protein